MAGQKVSTEPGQTPALVKDAHYHAVRATATWAAFVAGVRKAAVDSAAERSRRQGQLVRETTYDRGTLGGS
jgi:hypothetical protein